MNGAFNEFEQYCRTVDVQATDLLQLYMENLNAGQYYRIELRAHNAMGFSQPGPLMLKTARGEVASDSYNADLYEASFASSSPPPHGATALQFTLTAMMILFVACSHNYYKS